MRDHLGRPVNRSRIGRRLLHRHSPARPAHARTPSLKLARAPLSCSLQVVTPFARASVHRAVGDAPAAPAEPMTVEAVDKVLDDVSKGPALRLLCLLCLLCLPWGARGPRPACHASVPWGTRARALLAGSSALRSAALCRTALPPTAAGSLPAPRPLCPCYPGHGVKAQPGLPGILGPIRAPPPAAPALAPH